MTEFKDRKVGEFYPVYDDGIWRIGLKVSVQHMITCPSEGTYYERVNATARCKKLNTETPTNA